MTFDVARPPMHHSWSPSKILLYEACARKAAYKYLDKLPDPPGPALARGTEIHKHAELYVIGEAKDLHPTLAKAKDFLDVYREAYAKGDAYAELELAFKEGWARCDWFDPMVVSRFKIDLVRRDLKTRTLYVDDVKTGAFKPEADGAYQDQISLYCLAFGTLLVNKAHPWLEELAAGDWTLKAGLYFTDHGKAVVGEGLVPSKFEALKAAWEVRVNRLLSDTEHVPTPGPGCRFCPWSKKKGGSCRF